jgi:glycosyltransferase involved in cell wall biosynthesis
MPVRNAYAEDSDINNMYNACDVGINTCLGEGFGLCNFEHASLGAAQVVSAVGGLVDIFGARSAGDAGNIGARNAGDAGSIQGPFAELIEPVATLYSVNLLNTNNGFARICRSEDFADALTRLYRNPEARIAMGQAAAAHIKANYNWNDILAKFCVDLDTYLADAAAGRAPVASMGPKPTA